MIHKELEWHNLRIAIHFKDNLPPAEKWPTLLLDSFDYPDHLNAGFELTDAMVVKGLAITRL